MRFLVYATPHFPIPPDQMPAVVDGALEWAEQHRAEIEQFGLFPGGGGFGIANVTDETALNQLLLDMPFAPFSQHQIHTFVPGIDGLQQLRTSLAARAGMMQPH
ncbi:MAG TPA: hypothetical protein VGM91_23655 [Conexibacter sp.]|jgi:hypothetical protein